MRPLLLALIRSYQYLLRPLLGANCRFAPSCSEYAHEAVSTHGAIRGSWLALRRVLRCHPYHPGGYDPVPEVRSPSESSSRSSSLSRPSPRG